MNNEPSKKIFPGEVFANTRDFDLSIRQLIPQYDRMLEAIAWCLPTQSRRILELGCGTGELSLKILNRCRAAQIVALDYSPRMISFASAKIKSAGLGDRFSVYEMDFGDWANGRESEIGSGFDACVSSLAIHHLSNEMKLKLMRQIRDHLKSGGVFWNADPILPESSRLSEIYSAVREEWTSQQGTNLARVRAKIGKSDPYGYSSHDRLATLEEHLQMLKEAGFQSIAVPWKYYGMAVFGGVV